MLLWVVLGGGWWSHYYKHVVANLNIYIWYRIQAFKCTLHTPVQRLSVSHRINLESFVRVGEKLSPIDLGEEAEI